MSEPRHPEDELATFRAIQREQLQAITYSLATEGLDPTALSVAGSFNGTGHPIRRVIADLLAPSTPEGDLVVALVADHRKRLTYELVGQLVSPVIGPDALRWDSAAQWARKATKPDPPTDGDTEVLLGLQALLLLADYLEVQ